MNIRKAEKKDFSRMIDLSRGFTTSPYAFDKRFTALSYTFYPAFAQDMIQSSASFSLILEDETGTAGFITFSVNSALSGIIGKKTANILLLSVDEPRRCRGYGKILVRQAIGYLYTLGVEIITVGTDLYNYAAVRVYQDCGFSYRMSWHIFRRYPGKNGFTGKILERIEPYDSESLKNFQNIFNRPVSLLKEKTVDSGVLKKHLCSNMMKGIEKGSSSALIYRSGGKSAGLINVGRDEIARKSLQIDKNIYKILDVSIHPDWEGKGIEKSMLEDVCVRFPEAAMFEIWIEAENDSLIQAAEDAGFRLSYTGLSFHHIRM